MKRLSTWCGVMVLVAACSENSTSKSTAAVTPVTCAAGQVPFNFSKFTSPLTSEGLSSLAPDAKLPVIKRTPNVIKITRATCNRDFDWQSILGEFCDGRESCVINRQDCPGNLQYTYSCSANPSETKSYICNGTYDCVGSLSCPQPDVSWAADLITPDKVVCVPEKCAITQRRDKDLNCVDAPERPVEFSNHIEDHNPATTADDEYINNTLYISEMRSPYPAIGFRDLHGSGAVADFDYSNVWPFSGGPSNPASYPFFNRTTNDIAGSYRVLFAGAFYRMKGAYEFTDARNVPIEDKTRHSSVTLYVVDDYGLPTLTPANTLGPYSVTDSVVRCVLHEFDLSKYTPQKDATRTDLYYANFDEPVVVPRDCEEGGPIWSENVKVLAKKRGKTPLDFLNSYRLMRSRLLAAYDVAGTVTYVDQKPGEAAKTCNPNPLDMFYNSTLETHDRVAYYQQRAVPLVFQFTAADHSWEAPATREGQRVKEGGIHIKGATKTTIGVSGIRPKKIEFKFKSASKTRQFFRADVDWFMSGDDRDFWKTQGLTGSVRAKMDLSLVPVNADNSPRYSDALPLGPSPLLTSTPEGETQSMRFEISKTVKDKFTDPSSAYFATQAGTPYVLRSCISLVSVQSNGTEVPVEQYNGKTQLAAGAGTSGSLWIGPAEYGQERLELLSQYTCTTSEMPIVVKLDPSIAPLPGDEADQFSDSDPQPAGDARVSQTYDQDNDRRCVKAMVAGKNGENCDSRTISGLGGSTAATILRTEASNVDKGDQVVVDKEAELMGLQVFDEEEPKNFAFMSNKANFTITIMPNFDSIADAINEANTGNGIKAEEEHFSIGVSGLGLGLEIKIPLRYGPVQGEIIFEISAGVGVGAELKFTQERETHLKCADGTNNCDALYTIGTTPKNFRDARAACLLNNGGKLADLRTASESTKLRAKLSAGQQYWIGGQVANEYMKGCAALAETPTAFAQAAFLAACTSQHKTHMRWLSNDEDFASRTSNGNFVADLTEIQPGTPALTLRGNTLELPKERGISLTASGELNTPEMSLALPYVCKAPDSNYAVKNEAELTIKLAAGAGMKLAFCTPSADMGVCIEGTLDFIEASLEPKITYTHIGVGDSTGSSYISRSNIKLSMEFGMVVLHGEVNAKIVFSVGIFDFELKYNIVEYSGFKIPTGDPVEKEFPLTGEPQ